MVNPRQIALGLALLLLGGVFYVVARPPQDTYLLANAPDFFSFYGLFPAGFGYFGRFLPDFLHVMAFSLLTAGVLSCGRTGYLLICLFWLVINAGFELGQKYTGPATSLVPEWFEGIFLLENTANYFTCGTYSSLDLVAFLAGAFSAYIILIFTIDKNQGAI